MLSASPSLSSCFIISFNVNCNSGDPDYCLPPPRRASNRPDLGGSAVKFSNFWIRLTVPDTFAPFFSGTVLTIDPCAVQQLAVVVTVRTATTQNRPKSAGFTFDS